MLLREKLRFLKQRDHLTTKDLARFTGIPIGTINKILNGATAHPSLDAMIKIADVFQVPVHYLGDDEQGFPPFEMSAFAEDKGLLSIGRDEYELLMLYRNMSHQAQKICRARLETLATLCPADRRDKVRYALNPDGGLSVHICAVRPNKASALADFAILIDGCGLEPRYPAGCLLGVRSGGVKPGDLGVFMLNGIGYVRLLQQRGGIRKLLPIRCGVPVVTVRAGDVFLTYGTVTGRLAPLDPAHIFLPVDDRCK